jgi:hypothetical protein
MGGLSVLFGALFLLTGSGEQLRYLVVMLGGAALCLAAVWPTFRPGRWTTAAFVLAGMAAAPATYWIRRRPPNNLNRPTDRREPPAPSAGAELFGYLRLYRSRMATNTRTVGFGLSHRRRADRRKKVEAPR